MSNKTVVVQNLSNSVSKIVNIHARATKRRGKLLKTLLLKARLTKTLTHNFSKRSECEFCGKSIGLVHLKKIPLKLYVVYNTIV